MQVNQALYEEPMATTNVDTWIQAKIQNAFTHRKSNMGTSELPLERNSRPSKWVFQYRYVSETKKLKYKGCLVAKSFKQKHGLDYDELFSLVVWVTTL